MNDTQRNGSRISIPLALAIGFAGTILTGGAAWGVYSNRVETVEVNDRAQDALLQQHDRQITEVRAQYGEIIRRLDRIDRKLEDER